MNEVYSNWDDVVFEYRNKDYGAYLLRYNHPIYVTISALVVIVLFLTGILVPGLFREKQSEIEGKRVLVIDYIVLKPAPSVHKIKVPKLSVAKQATPKVVKEEVETEEEKPPETKPKQEGKPAFPGGMEALYEWLSEHLEYPPIAKRMGIEGSVTVEFTVDENGKISNVRIKESLNKLFDDEALRVIMSMPDWTPGYIDGVKTAQKYLLPIRFALG